MLPALAIALLLDIIYPEHRGIALRLHPVHTSYFMTLLLAKPGSSKAVGVIVWLAVMISHLSIAALALAISSIHPALWIIVASVILKLSFSIKLLVDICEGAKRELSAGRLEEGRRYVQMIVRRNVYQLDEPRVVSAAIESLAESLVDGFTSPLFYYALLGPLGALAQRIANTLDGAIGFRTPEYANVGWFSAKMDTLFNYLPARMTAITIAISAPVAGGSVSKAFSVWLKWRGVTQSVNAGHPMSAMAGALDVMLEKPNHYVINANSKLPRPEDIGRAIKVIGLSATIWIVMLSIYVALLS